MSQSNEIPSQDKLADDFNDTYEEQVADLDKVDTDIRINPQYYLHRDIVLAQNCLIKDNVREGLMQYCVIIKDMETIAIASGMVNRENYEKAVTEFMQTSDEYKNATDEDKLLHLSNKKKELICYQLFHSRATFSKPFTVS